MRVPAKTSHQTACLKCPNFGRAGGWRLPPDVRLFFTPITAARVRKLDLAKFGWVSIVLASVRGCLDTLKWYYCSIICPALCLFTSPLPRQPPSVATTIKAAYQTSVLSFHLFHSIAHPTTPMSSHCFVYACLISLHRIRGKICIFPFIPTFPCPLL